MFENTLIFVGFCCLSSKLLKKRNYIREVINGKQQYVASGWTCPSSTCDYIAKDFVELEDTEELE